MGEWLLIGPEGTRAYLAMPEAESGPGVLVLHAWWGLTTDFTGVCDRLAGNGFVALGPSLYPGGATAETIAEAEQLIAAHDSAPDEAREVVLAAADHLLELPAVTGDKIAVIGFSMGGYWALHLSQVRPDKIGAVVAVYGSDDGDYSTAKAAYLLHFAERDEYEPVEAVRSLESRIGAAGREVTTHVYPNTVHWFVEPSQPDAYDAVAAELVWERTVAFLKERLAGTRRK